MNDDATELAILVDQLPDLICRYRPDGLLFFVNAAYADFFDRHPDDLLGRSLLELVPMPLRRDAEASLRRVQAMTVEAAIIMNEHRSADGNGRYRWHQWTEKGIFDGAGNLVEVISVGRDVTERRMAEEQAAYLASHDSLTGLLNRRSLLLGLQQALVRTAVEEQTLAVLYVDLDQFKSVNDEFGHSTGDRVLEEAAERLLASFRPVDLVARLGGDEFVVVCTDIGLEARITRLVARLAETLAEPMIGLGGLRLGASIGWTLSDGSHSPEMLIDAADAAMYSKKRARS